MSGKTLSPSAPLARFNAAFGRVLLALWPEENKAWGIAFTSESVAIDSPLQQFRWLLGGVSVLLRESFHSFLRSLRRPIGVGPGDVIGIQPDHGRSPRTPRLVLAFLVLLFVWLFWQPQTRAVFRSISETHTSQGWDASHWPEVQRIRSVAGKSRDPQLLAFASLLYTQKDKRLALADSAIQADPSLTWIDYQNAFLPANNTFEQRPLSEIRMGRLLATDPQNGALQLLRAESIADPYLNAASPADRAGWKSRAAQDPRWLAAMQAAFAAPRFDNYDSRLFDLSRTVIARYSVNDPRILGSVLGRRSVAQYVVIKAYTDFLLSRASNARGAGNIQSAMQDCSLILDFAQHFRANNVFRMEAWIANDIESQAYPLLQSLYEDAGNHRQALDVAARIQANREERANWVARSNFRSREFPYWSRNEWAAFVMQSSVLAIWILLPLSLISIVLLWLMRRALRTTSGTFHSLLCLFSDVCPSFLVLACALLFITYLPYDESYRQILRAPFSAVSLRGFERAVYAPFLLPASVMSALGSLSGPQGRLLLWSALIAVLALLAALLAYRQLPRRHSN